MGLWGKRADMVVHEIDPYNAEPPSVALAGSLLTPLDAFYSRNHGPVPTIDIGAWRLTVDGLVERPLRLSLEQLQRDFATRTVVATLQCAGNRRAGLIAVRDIPGEDPWGPAAISTAGWTGVSLADVLTAAGLSEQAEHVAFAAPDVSELAQPAQPYGSSIGVKKALSPEVLLAWSVNGQALPPIHGAPVRVVVPGFVGARSVKWVERITARREPSDNYFQATAYRLLPAEADPSTAGPGDGLSLGAMAINAEFLAPAVGAAVVAGPLGVIGYAVAGDDRGIARVDVSADGGDTWVQADLGEELSPWAWRHWRTTLDLSPGEVEITARAWDTSAGVQPESARHLWNPKGYVNTSWARLLLTVR